MVCRLNDLTWVTWLIVEWMSHNDDDDYIYIYCFSRIMWGLLNVSQSVWEEVIDVFGWTFEFVLHGNWKNRFILNSLPLWEGCHVLSLILYLVHLYSWLLITERFRCWLPLPSHWRGRITMLRLLCGYRGWCSNSALIVKVKYQKGHWIMHNVCCLVGYIWLDYTASLVTFKTYHV